MVILGLTVGANFSIRTNSNKTQVFDRSLFFVYLKTRPEWNEKLVETYETVNLKLSQNTLENNRQVLAATAIDKEKVKTLAVMPLPTLSGSALLKPNPAGNAEISLPKRDIEVYEVRGGDTLARIAAAYGVSIDTIMWENNLSSANYLRVGQELKILPVSGVRHVVKSGETISGIAKKYGVDMEDILEYNNIEIEDHILAGEEIIIPNGVKKALPTPQRQQYLAEVNREDYKKVDVPSDYRGDDAGLIWPLPNASRISQYFWSRHRALDIPCRDCPIVAAGGGIVELSGWQRGYGNTIVINHGGGVKTRYAHGKQNLVSAGDQVTQGQTIMISGSTGRSTGPHLHVEVKINGELVNPLPLLRR